MRWPCAVLCLLLTTALPAQIRTGDAGVRSPDLPSLRELGEMREYEHATEARATTELVYSPHRRFETRLQVPFLGRDQDLPGLDDMTFGFGDVSLQGKLALLRDDDVMVSDRIALLVTAYAPTGDDDHRVNGVRMPRRLQAGLGAPGVGLGAAGTIVRDRHRASLVGQWVHFGAHEGFTPGDEVRVDVAWWYRLAPVAFAPDDERSEVRFVAELNAGHHFADRENGVRGGDGLRLDGLLGLQVNSNDQARRVEVAAIVPLQEDAPGPQGRAGLGVLFALTFYF